MRISVKNWSKYQSKSDKVRHPQWFKLNNSIINNEKFYNLSDLGFKVFISLLCIASSKNSANFNLNIDWFCYTLKKRKSNILSALSSLESLDIISIGNASHSSLDADANDFSDTESNCTMDCQSTVQPIVQSTDGASYSVLTEHENRALTVEKKRIEKNRVEKNRTSNIVSRNKLEDDELCINNSSVENSSSSTPCIKEMEKVSRENNPLQPFLDRYKIPASTVKIWAQVYGDLNWVCDNLLAISAEFDVGDQPAEFRDRPAVLRIRQILDARFKKLSNGKQREPWDPCK